MLAMVLLVLTRPRDEQLSHSASTLDVTESRELQPAIAGEPEPAPKPVGVEVDAAIVRGDEVAARDEREAVLASLRDSGPSAESWDAQATMLLDSVARSPAAASETGCFVAGCGATFTFPSKTEYQRRLDSLLASDGYLAWTGGRRLTAPETRPDGRIVMALVLYRPD